MPSPFLSPFSHATANSLAILHLKRDHLLPTILQAQDLQNEGYSEGKVTNTRFGSFPHSTLIGLQWGSQVRASAVDTGSRGRPRKKRKRGDDEGSIERDDHYGNEEEGEGKRGAEASKTAVAASTGFVHLLPPTPEIWTTSLPHRTQVVYTPDYSYILHRLRARPGSILIEAGAGSGSFTHAAARAVYNGYPDCDVDSNIQPNQRRRRGKVWSYEFHEQRVEKLRKEITEHGLNGVVEITHKDVCQDGFDVDRSGTEGVSANIVFLDLPAPWLALKHLRRNLNERSSIPDSSTSHHPSGIQSMGEINFTDISLENPPQLKRPQSLLDPNSAVHLCTFSPCIEQVQRTIATLRQLGWLDIEMVEIAARRIEVRRERVGLQEEGLRGVNASPATVDEAVAKLREVEGRTKAFHNECLQEVAGSSEIAPASKQQRLESIRHELKSRKLYKEGRLCHRAEPELKTHTSYLVFAILPREWTAADELSAREKWPVKVQVAEQAGGVISNRQMKRNAKVKNEADKDMETQESIINP